MKSLRRKGCRTTFLLIFALGTFIFLFTQSRQGRSELSVRQEQRNVTMFGGDVRIGEDERIPGNLLVVGDDLTLEGRIGGNLVVVGGDADLTGQAKVGGNFSVIGGDAHVAGSSVIGGNVAAVGGDVELAGHAKVGGSVRVVGGGVKQDPTVLVGGGASGLNYTNRVSQQSLNSAAAAPLTATGPPKRPDPPIAQVVDSGRPGESAQARVELIREAAEEAADAAAEAAEEAAELAEEAAEDWAEAAVEAAEEWERASLVQGASARTPWFLVFLGKLVQAFLWTVLITGLVLLFSWLLPNQVKAVSETAEEETALSFATGAIGIVGSAILTAILTITICFALLALPLLALLALVVLCGWTVSCYWLGRRLDELVAGQGELPWNPLISVGLSSLVITGVTAFSWVIFPCLGFIVGLLIGSTGTGAAVVHIARRSGRLPGGVLGSRPDDPEPDGEETAGELAARR
jgi:nucleotide-binding universal stress UspA family protein